MQYIGQTTRTLSIRKIEHKSHAKTKHFPLYIAINAFGFDNFVFEEINNSSEAEAIKQYNTLWPVGYNMESGGDEGFKVHPETNKLHSKRTKGRDNSYLNKPIECSNGLIYESIKIAAKNLSIDESHVVKVLKGKRKSTGGFHFSYLSEKVG